MLQLSGIRPAINSHGVRLTGAVTVAIGLVMVAAVPGPAKAEGVPDLRGVWVAPQATCRNADKVASTQQKLEVVAQDGQLVKADFSYVTSGNAPIGETQGRAVGTATEPVIGTIAADGRTVYLAEVGDDGMLILQDVGPDGFSAIYIEAGDHPLACASAFSRQGG